VESQKAGRPGSVEWNALSRLARYGAPMALAAIEGTLASLDSLEESVESSQTGQHTESSLENPVLVDDADCPSGVAGAMFPLGICVAEKPGCTKRFDHLDSFFMNYTGHCEFRAWQDMAADRKLRMHMGCICVPTGTVRVEVVIVVLALAAAAVTWLGFVAGRALQAVLAGLRGALEGLKGAQALARAHPFGFVRPREPIGSALSPGSTF
jgi:hypothetical protein